MIPFKPQSVDQQHPGIPGINFAACIFIPKVLCYNNDTMLLEVRL